LGGAKALGFDGTVGEVRAGMLADLVLIDLADLAYQPLNSAARQLVFSETGQGVHTVMVDGRIVLSGGNLTTLDERAFRLELAEVMKAVDRDYAELAARQQPAVTFLLKANRNLKGAKMGPNRMISDGSN
jgi:hypothetical protein